MRCAAMLSPFFLCNIFWIFYQYTMKCFIVYFASNFLFLFVHYVICIHFFMYLFSFLRKTESIDFQMSFAQPHLWKTCLKKIWKSYSDFYWNICWRYLFLNWLNWFECHHWMCAWIAKYAIYFSAMDIMNFVTAISQKYRFGINQKIRRIAGYH